ncbi:MAG: VWA domain-containing protein [Candidatus Marinimicrobia bacterium]|nr:VWA domain-containing protein [Candidatus Neomarinimicrobiota bacterium]MBT5224947.1 VWA domain-containing protein [Candidatus Neomarinimicrobiota bacterium]
MIKYLLNRKYIFLVSYCICFCFAKDNCAQQIFQPAVNNFSIVIDRSGSMNGRPMTDAKEAVNHFIGELRSSDRANLITFETRVSMSHDFSSDKSSIIGAVKSIKVGGATALYDAIARAASTLRQESGAKIIVFLTDGDDTGSKFFLRDLESMNLSEGIFVYGIGLGRVNTTSLDRLVKATGGTYYPVKSSGDLNTIYDRVVNAYYNNYGRNLSKTASMTVRSLPSNMSVIIDGKERGKTPFKLDGLAPKNANVKVQFNRGEWDCLVDLKAGYRAVVDARESDLGKDVLISSIPFGASVFLDGNYVGETPVGQLAKQQKKGLFKKNIQPAVGKLRVPLVPKGSHTLRVVAVPEMEMGLEYEFKFNINNRERSVNIDLFSNRHEFSDGESGSKTPDPFDELNNNDGDSKDPFDELDNF